MLKLVPFFYSSPPKSTKEAKIECKEAVKPLSLSESEPDSISIESSSEEAHPKDNMKTEILSETDCDQVKPKKPLRKIVHALFYGVEKSKEKKPQKEENQPVTAGQIRELIKDQKFSEASQHLLILQRESSGDLDNKSEIKKLASETEIETLFDLLKQKVFGILQSSVSSAPGQPELLQNAVKAVIDLVEEEERLTSEGKDVCSQCRNWKEDWRNTIESSVEERMKATPLINNDGLSTIAWSFVHMGKTMKEDLITVVQYIKHYYPEHFQVCSTYAKFYHNCFSSQLKMFAGFELSHKDVCLLLTWVQNLYPKKIKNHHVLVKELDEAGLGSLLPLEQIKQLELTYLAHEVDAVKCWLAKYLEIEVGRWNEGNEPEKLEGYFHSELSIDAIQTIYGIQKCAEDITPDLGQQISVLLLTELLTFLQSYKKELETFIKEKKQHQYFEATIIANINNCVRFRTHTEKRTDSTQNDVKMKIFSILNDIQNIGFDVFLHHLLQELQPLFKKFTEKKWAFCTDVMDNIITVTRVHVSAFKALEDPLRQVIMEKIHLHLIQQYITRLLRKKVSFRSPEQQNQLSELIRNNASSLHTFCTEHGSNASWLQFALPSLSEIIRLQDPDAIMVEVGALASTYPDISRKHLSAILYIKGNLSSGELRSILSVLNISGNATLPPSSLFSAIRVP